MAEWFVRSGEDGQRGPYTSEDMLASVRGGYLTDATVVRPSDAPEAWRPLSEYRSAMGLPPSGSPAVRSPASLNEPRPYEAQEPSPHGGGDVAIGAVAVVIGLFLTLGSYSAAASSGGGHYVLAMGPIVWGVVRIIRGLSAPGR